MPRDSLMQLHGVAEDGQRPQAEEVHLEQAELLDRAHGEAGDQLGAAWGPCRAGRARSSGSSEITTAGGVDGGVARAALQRSADVPQLASRAGSRLHLLRPAAATSRCASSSVMFSGTLGTSLAMRSTSA